MCPAERNDLLRLSRSGSCRGCGGSTITVRLGRKERRWRATTSRVVLNSLQLERPLAVRLGELLLSSRLGDVQERICNIGRGRQTRDPSSFHCPALEHVQNVAPLPSAVCRADTISKISLLRIDVRQRDLPRARSRSTGRAHWSSLVQATALWGSGEKGAGSARSGSLAI